MQVSKYKQYKYMGFDTYDKIYKSTVVPIMDYGSEVWGINKYSKDEIVQNQAARSFLGVNRFAPVDGMQGDLGWNSSRTRRKVNVLRYWNRLTTMSDDRLTKQVFLWDHAIGKDNWCESVKSILADFSFENEVYLNKQNVNINEVSNRAREFEQSCWEIRCVGKPKLRTYTTFKDSLETENYVKYNLTRKERSFIAQLRLGILPMRIKTGRYEKLAPECRLCEFCTANEIENEEHFIFKCKLNEKSRVHQSIYSNISVSNYCEIWKTLFVKHPRQFGRFIISAYQNRKNEMYTRG